MPSPAVHCFPTLVQWTFYIPPTCRRPLVHRAAVAAAEKLQVKGTDSARTTWSQTLTQTQTQTQRRTRTQTRTQTRTRIDTDVRTSRLYNTHRRVQRQDAGARPVHSSRVSYAGSPSRVRLLESPETDSRIVAYAAQLVPERTKVVSTGLRAHQSPSCTVTDLVVRRDRLGGGKERKRSQRKRAEHYRNVDGLACFGRLAAM